MGAFNRRLQPKEIFGMPLAGALGLVGVVIFGVLTLLLPAALKILTGMLLFGSLALSGLGFYFGDDLQMVRVMWAGRVVEKNRVTSETWSNQ